MKRNTHISRRNLIALLSSAFTFSTAIPLKAQTKYKRIRTQYIAALAPGGVQLRIRR